MAPITEGAHPHYRRPGRLARAGGALVAGITACGLSVRGSRVLEVPGRRSGVPRRNPVNLLDLDGRQFLVAPRGETEWVRNVRANQGLLALRLGRRSRPYRVVELDETSRVPVLRAYLRRWQFEVGVFFDGVGPEADDEALAAVAARHPVFELSPAD